MRKVFGSERHGPLPRNLVSNAFLLGQPGPSLRQLTNRPMHGAYHGPPPQHMHVLLLPAKAYA